MNDISLSLDVLNSMLTPSVLMLVCGSLTLATSQRLNRVIERTRRLFDIYRGEGEGSALNSEEEVRHLLLLIDMQTKRVNFLQRALTVFYVSLSVFVLTSVLIGVLSITHLSLAWIPLSVGMAGAALLFYGTLLLMLETRIALSAVRMEMDFIRKLILVEKR